MCCFLVFSSINYLPGYQLEKGEAPLWVADVLSTEGEKGRQGTPLTRTGSGRTACFTGEDLGALSKVK